MEIPGYQITGTLGEGGMASVYKATQVSLDRQVAIKVLKQTMSDHEELRAKFIQESLIIARLNHPHIIQVIDRGFTEEGCPYFIMPLVKSTSLRAIYKRGNLPINRALDIFLQIVKALGYAHKNGVIHCDIKPENILVDFEGNVRILDFGIALLIKNIQDADENKTDFIMGTEAYMAPEQELGSSNATPQADIYSLGVMMYEYFNHALPRNPPANLHDLNHSIPMSISNIVMSCLHKSPGKRPEKAEALKYPLLQALQGGHLNTDQRRRAQSDVKKSFKLLDVINEDKYGAVYLFEEQTRHDFLVIKKRKNSVGGYEDAKKLVGFSHPNVAKLYGTSKNDRVFILVQQYCRGGSLLERLASIYDIDEFYYVALGIAQGMRAAHDQGLFHGNLRPSNILFDEQGCVKIVDFGLIEHYAESNKNWYSRPNEPMGELADIYAVGVIFYQMVIGQPPGSEEKYVLNKHRFSELPKPLQILIRAMIHKDSEKRIQSFDLVIKALLKNREEQKTVVKVIPQEMELEETEVPEERKVRKPLIWGLVITLLIAATLYVQGYFLATGDLQSLFESLLN